MTAFPRAFEIAQLSHDLAQKLRYKDYHLAAKPIMVTPESPDAQRPLLDGLHEISSVKGFGLEMERIGVSSWWRKAMGFVNHDTGGVTGVSTLPGPK